MSDKPENPQAFPTGDHTHGGHDGMTLRDWFAGQAMQGMLADGSAWETAKLARDAYKAADAMLAERERSK